MERCKAEILDITETKQKGRGLAKNHKGYWLLRSEVDVIARGRGEAGLVVVPDRLIDIRKQNYIDDRILKV